MVTGWFQRAGWTVTDLRLLWAMAWLDPVWFCLSKKDRSLRHYNTHTHTIYVMYAHNAWARCWGETIPPRHMDRILRLLVSGTAPREVPPRSHRPHQTAFDPFEKETELVNKRSIGYSFATLSPFIHFLSFSTVVTLFPLSITQQNTGTPSSSQEVNGKLNHYFSHSAHEQVPCNPSHTQPPTHAHTTPQKTSLLSTSSYPIAAGLHVAELLGQKEAGLCLAPVRRGVERRPPVAVDGRHVQTTLAQQPGARGGSHMSQFATCTHAHTHTRANYILDGF